ncbi:MAG: hypothetical protein OEY20_04325, partial [Gemmatimonadota bacterium]|nr:hypothetical protein [Gemmatimonadota bacterium]
LQRVTGAGWIGETDVAEIDAQVEVELDAAVADCEREPLPEPETALTGVFVRPATAPALWFRGLDG